MPLWNGGSHHSRSESCGALGSQLRVWTHIKYPFRRSGICRSRPSSTPFINLLPPEILGDIFTRCLPPAHRPPTSANQAPMVLCQVCSYWRHIALSLGTLWSSFASGVLPIRRASHPSLIRLWLNRSGNYPLTLKLGCSPTSSMVMEELLKDIHRWRDIFFALDRNLGEKFVTIRGGSAPSLEEVAVNVKSRNWDIDRLASVLNSLPALRRLAWSGEPAPSTFVNLHWPQLTHISIFCDFPLDDCITMLSHAPAVEHAEFWQLVSASSIVSPDLLVSLQHLQSLMFRVNSNSGEIGLFDHLILPSLVYLDAPIPNDCNVLRRFDERSLCKIKTFTLDNRSAITEAVCFCLQMQCMQSLRRLRLLFSASDQVMECLTWSPRAESGVAYILPHLTYLTLGRCTNKDGIISNMISSRCQPIITENPPAMLELATVSYNRDSLRVLGNGDVPRRYPKDVARFFDLGVAWTDF